jgi:hypothetical protein
MDDTLKIQFDPDKRVLDRVKEIITLPKEAAQFHQDPQSVEIPPEVVLQLRSYVSSSIASMYHNNNHFHPFDHASHVIMAVTKLLSQIVTPDAIDYNKMSYKKASCVQEQHQFTYGITSDPLLQFACVFLALIHDVDHPGLPNGVLVQEGTSLAKF